MQIPRATFYIESNRLFFRMDNLPPKHFYRYLHLIRKQVPDMRWDRHANMWLLSIQELKVLYEVCRLLFGADQVKFYYSQYMRKVQPIQPRLPGLEEE